jgi:hypothetical protein
MPVWYRRRPAAVSSFRASPLFPAALATRARLRRAATASRASRY